MRRRSVDWADKAISSPVQGLDKPGVVGIISQRLTQLLYRGVQAQVEIDERVLRPKALPQFFPSDDLIGAFQQHDQNLKRLVRELDPYAGLAQLACLQIELEKAEPDHIAI